MERLQENNSKRRKENMEERLTKRAKDSDMVWFKDTENGNMCLEPCEMDAHHSRIAIKELAKYEDAEEQGLLLRLPCKVGDTLYRVNKGAKEPVIMMRVIQLHIKQIHKDRTVMRIDAINDADMGESCYLPCDIGERIFLTREEAEAKLKEMEGK